MKLIAKGVGGFFAVSLLASPVIAQQSDWEFEGTIYLFTAETTTSITTPARTVEGQLSFSDALSNLDFAFMGAFGASNGRWTIMMDYMYTDLSFGNPPPGPVFASVDTSLKTQILNGYVAYRVYEQPSVQFDLAAGFRWFDTKTTITLHPTPPGGSNTTDENWIDPVMGFRARFKLSDRWAATTFFDYGGFQSGDETWQALLTADYTINDNWVLRGGYRYITVDHTIGADEFSFTQSGPIFGATYRF